MPSKALNVNSNFKNASREAAPPQRKRPAPFSLRLTPEERKSLEIKAGDLSLSSYIRWCVFHDCVPKPRIRGTAPVKDHQALSRVLGALGKSNIANNLNQIAKAVHTGNLVLPDHDLKVLNEACQSVSDIRRDIIRALGLRESDS